mmetsp:Transcript_5602/g.13186  ORF Transcript_5602/g.13186 Transcript_5602/m.13186 type:complete len:143 (-) Transcript_5602:567-995(-)
MRFLGALIKMFEFRPFVLVREEPLLGGQTLQRNPLHFGSLWSRWTFTIHRNNKPQRNIVILHRQEKQIMNTEVVSTENPGMGVKPSSSRRPLQRLSVNNSPKMPSKKRVTDGNVSVTLLYPGYFLGGNILNRAKSKIMRNRN